MPNGGNLPKLIKYKNNIKDITISKFAGSNAGEFGDCYFIKFTELIESEKEQKKFFWIKEKVKEISEKEHALPFTFKSLEIAKDFAQYLPNISFGGERLYTKDKSNKMVLYETYQLYIDGISVIIYLKFIPSCEHYTTQLRKNSKNGYDEYYVNDLDKKYFDGSQGNWYNSEELVIDGFFTAYDLKLNYENPSNSKIIPKVLFEKISDIKQIENESTHKFILVENQ